MVLPIINPDIGARKVQPNCEAWYAPGTGEVA